MVVLLVLLRELGMIDRSSRRFNYLELLQCGYPYIISKPEQKLWHPHIKKVLNFELICDLVIVMSHVFHGVDHPYPFHEKPEPPDRADVEVCGTLFKGNMIPFMSNCFDMNPGMLKHRVQPPVLKSEGILNETFNSDRRPHSIVEVTHSIPKPEFCEGVTLMIVVSPCHESKMITNHMFIWFVNKVEVVDDEQQVEIDMDHNEPHALTHV